MLGADRTGLLVVIRERFTEKLGSENPDDVLGADVPALGVDVVVRLGAARCAVAPVRRAVCACNGSAQTKTAASTRALILWPN